MNYPLDVEICVKTFTEAEGYKDSSVEFLRACISLLNEIYKDGFNNTFPGVSIEEIMLKNCENEIRECFGVHFEEFLSQASDAYKQGQTDKAKNTTNVLKQSVSSVR